MALLLVPPIHIADEPPIFSQSDLDVGSFGIDLQEDHNTVLVLLNFGRVGRLPMSLAKYGMGSTGRATFSDQVTATLMPLWPPTDDNRESNKYSMVRVSACLWMNLNQNLVRFCSDFRVSNMIDVFSCRYG